MKSKLHLIILAMCLLCISCTSQKKEQERAENTAKAVAAIGTLAAIKVANDVYEFGRVQPHVASWDQGQIEVVGIKASQINEFYIWSVSDSKLLWWLTPASQSEDYSKKSRNERFMLTYGAPPEVWKQKHPTNGLPDEIDGGIILVYFHYSFPFMVGMRGESEICYIRLNDESTEILRQSELGTNSWITIQRHWKIWDTVNRTMVNMSSSTKRNGE